MTDTSMTESAVREVLAAFPDPETGRSIVQMEQVPALRVAPPRIEVTLALTTWAAPLWLATRDELAARLRQRFPQADVVIEVVAHARPSEKQGEIGLSAKSIVAVGAGKGGVGKSSVAAYLAYGLIRAGCRVGMMDADVYGPSMPHLVGATERPFMLGERIQPVERHGLKLMSMGLLVPKADAIVWRGPMLHNALTQFLRDTEWGDLDYLIVDMPPGTGDVAISLSHLLPGSGAVVVCTPQELAVLDAVKAVDMFQKVGIEVLGMVENMSYFICPNCTTRHELFGAGGARAAAERLGVRLLGELPLTPRLRVLGDEGQVEQSLDDPEAGPVLQSLAPALVRQLVERRRAKPVMPTLTILS